MTSPTISVVVPVFNAAQHLDVCMQSLQEQGIQEAEFIFVNDGSTDESVAILTRWQKYDERVRVLNQANQGASVARNHGIDQALGDYVYFLDSDDRLMPGALGAMQAKGAMHDADLVHIDASVWQDQQIERHDIGLLKRLNRPYLTDEVLTGCALGYMMMQEAYYMPNPWLYCVKRSLLNQHKIRFYPGITNEDVLFSYALLLHAQRAVHLNQKLVEYRVHAGSITGINNMARTFMAHAVMHHQFGHRMLMEVAHTNKACANYYALARQNLYLTVIHLPESAEQIADIESHVNDWPELDQRYHAQELLMAAKAIKDF